MKRKDQKVKIERLNCEDLQNIKGGEGDTAKLESIPPKKMEEVAPPDSLHIPQ